MLLTGFLLSVWTGQNDRVRQFAGGLIAGRGLTEPIVISVLLAAFIDAGCRLFGRLRYARDVRRRPRAVAMLLYTAAFAIATIGPFFWLALLTSTTIVNAGLPRGMLAGFLFPTLHTDPHHLDRRAREGIEEWNPANQSVFLFTGRKRLRRIPG